MKRRLKRTTRKSLIAVVACSLVVCAVFTVISFVIITNMKKNYTQNIQALTKEIDSKKVYVYEAVSDISGGSEITEDKLKYVEVSSEMPKEAYMTREDIGKIALIDLESGTQILKIMLNDTPVEDNLREAMFNSFQINSNVTDNDYVDIRIMFPNGENYVVLSKKIIKNLNAESGNCYMWLDAEEIDRVSGAIVDCYINEGSKLYTVKYIEPSIQDASKITYTPSSDIINLINGDPNILAIASSYLNTTIRNELEDRLQQFNTEHEGEVDLTTDSLSSYVYEGSSVSDSSKEGNTNDLSEEDTANEEVYYAD